MSELGVSIETIQNIISAYNIPNDCKIYIQRIEDIYFEEHGWKPLLIPNEYYPFDNDEFTYCYGVSYNKELNILLFYGHY